MDLGWIAPDANPGFSSDYSATEAFFVTPTILQISTPLAGEDTAITKGVVVGEDTNQGGEMKEVTPSGFNMDSPG
ncbi:hypothetical protein [Siphonobacter sp. SORGH_AS_0500]|uniref:hypothetical protein n=1 Tax=Siphonobacter sp. SORGH_AS_0500 TaxID=1864824 RepID=UPI000CB9433A|nr:hypothetical protein [Siphonobacter sp. SORGH_AS_0500]MDR6193016.1 hypothetical protein [Siphonobacter sp. SORGH_AS_0500]PKK35703.1 hypothetical protein BWI96_15450 [Siphonobacter sp. SORGH_AS_0500]